MSNVEIALTILTPPRSCDCSEHELDLSQLLVLLFLDWYLPNKGNNKITELRAILQRESQNS